MEKAGEKKVNNKVRKEGRRGEERNNKEHGRRRTLWGEEVSWTERENNEEKKVGQGGEREGGKDSRGGEEGKKDEWVRGTSGETREEKEDGRRREEEKKVKMRAKEG